jgi:hypothetical protein
VARRLHRLPRLLENVSDGIFEAQISVMRFRILHYDSEVDQQHSGMPIRQGGSTRVVLGEPTDLVAVRTLAFGDPPQNV